MNKNYQNRVMQASKRGVVAALAWIVASAATASSSSPEQAISHLTRTRLYTQPISGVTTLARQH